MRVFTAGRTTDKSLQQIALALLDPVSEADHIDRNIILFEFLRETSEMLVVRRDAVERRSQEDDDALAQVLVLPVLQRKLGNVKGGGKFSRADDLALSLVHGGYDLPKLSCVCDKNFASGSSISTYRTIRAMCLPLACHSHDPSAVLWVRVRLGLEDEVNGVRLRAMGRSACK